MNGYLTIKETANKWGISIRRVNKLCNDGRIDGCIKFGASWAIPESAEKPKDLRVKTERNRDNKKGKERYDKISYH